MQNQGDCQLLNDVKGVQMVSSVFKLEKKVNNRWEQLVSVELLSPSGHLFNPIISKEESDAIFQKVLERKRRRDQWLGCEISDLGSKEDDSMEVGQIEGKKENPICRQNEVELQPAPKSNYCSICKKFFSDYFQHTRHPIHVKKISQDRRNLDLLDFIQNDTFGQQLQDEAEDHKQSQKIMNRRPTLSEYSRQFLAVEPMGQPRKMKQSKTETSNSTNIFSISASRNRRFC